MTNDFSKLTDSHKYYWKDNSQQPQCQRYQKCLQGQPTKLTYIHQTSKLERGTCPRCNRKNASPLLDLLEPETHPGSTAKMKTSRVSSKCRIQEIVSWMLRFSDGGFEFCHFGHECWIIGGKVTSYFGQNFNSFVSAAVGNQPSGRVGEERNCESDDKDGGGRECEGKAPFEAVA